MVQEHVSNGEKFYANILRLLSDGGVALNFGSDSILMKFGIRVELDSGESAPCNKHFAAPA
jgi:hypothetical protein